MFVSKTRPESVLAASELFQGMSRKELERFERLGRLVQYGTGEMIVKQGLPAIAFFVITRGAVQVIQSQAGQERELRRLAAGDGFGELALFHDRLRTASVVTLEPTDCIALHRLDFLNELRRSPDIAIHMLEILSERVVEAEERN
jgi:CRP-like cAMP-binding protein